MTITEIKPQTKQDLANAYGVSTRTLNKWLSPFQDEIGQRMGHTYTPKQVKIIYEMLGPPSGEFSSDDASDRASK